MIISSIMLLKLILFRFNLIFYLRLLDKGFPLSAKNIYDNSLNQIQVLDFFLQMNIILSIFFIPNSHILIQKVVIKVYLTPKTMRFKAETSFSSPVLELMLSSCSIGYAEQATLPKNNRI